MLQPKDAGGEENPDFKWGVKKSVGRTDKTVHFYESFTYEGTEYRLFDCAYFQVHGQCETSVGKLVRMYETSAGEKKVKVLWLFRPIEIRSYLGQYEPVFDELFLACGDGAGVYNINDVDAILGKCNVLCVSKDQRNPRPTRNEMRNANYVFSRTFDTRLKIISEDFADAIAGIRVENFFNKIRDKPPLKRQISSAATCSRPSPVKSFRSELLSTNLGKNDNRYGKQASGTRPVKKDLFLKDRVDHVHVRKNPPVNTDITSRGLNTKTRALGNSFASGSSVDPRLFKKRKLRYDSGPEPGETRFIKNPLFVDKAPSHNIGRSSWYKKLTFEDELKEAVQNDKVLLFENLEPSYTSLEVEDLCRKAFKERVDAKMIPSSPVFNPNYGRALVIFGTKKAADNAISRLTEGSLMLSDETHERPLMGSRYVPKKVDEGRRFTGHLRMLDKGHMSFEKRKAVATAHCAQPNHIVYEMASEWHALQGKSELQWKRIFEEQAKDLGIMSRKNPRETKGQEQDASPVSQQQGRTLVGFWFSFWNLADANPFCTLSLGGMNLYTHSPMLILGLGHSVHKQTTWQFF